MSRSTPSPLLYSIKGLGWKKFWNTDEAQKNENCFFFSGKMNSIRRRKVLPNSTRVFTHYAIGQNAWTSLIIHDHWSEHGSALWKARNKRRKGLFRMEATFNSDSLQTYTDFQISTHGKWKIDLFSNRICLNFENWWTKTTIPFSSKILSLNKFQNGASYPGDLLFWSPRLNDNGCQDYNNTLFNKTTQM